MALSQVQCLDDNHVNPRTHESKAEFLYCEDQRLALEALLRDGREALVKLQRDRGLRGFLSEPEMEALAEAVEPYDPGAELFPGDAEDDDEPPLSLTYWPELSDTSVPQMDLGWPDSEAYRGVTRATVYTQPPLDGQTHIKEVVRKMIAQAHKVIAVVMDVFTDVDIFRDLLDAGFKKRVSVYVLLERTSLPHFLSMCQRANMHAGHLKHLRVRCSEGSEFCTRSCSRVKGQLGHRFMFVDGDKAVSGSYSFTWMSSRLDRNLITVVTGQAVDSFDRLFRFLYVNSSFVDLRQVATEPEPAPEPVQQAAPVAPPSAADLRKLYNPKYALLMAGCPNMAPSSGPKEPDKSESSKSPEVPEGKKRRLRRSSKDAPQEAPPLHPGLCNLEKACLISYLPTWPEPDPPSDVIGFINIRNTNKPVQVHLQRSERFETSQAIRFSSPFSVAEEILPEVAQPRKLTPKRTDKHQTAAAQAKAKAEESVMGVDQATQPSAEPDDVKMKGETLEENLSRQKSEAAKDADSKTPTDTGHNPTPQVTVHTPAQPSSHTSTPSTGRSSHSGRTLATSGPEPLSLPGSHAGAETEAEPQSAAGHRTRPLESEKHKQTHNVQTPTVHSHLPTSSAPPAATISTAPPLQPAPVTSTSSAPPVSSTSSGPPVQPTPVTATSSAPPLQPAPVTSTSSAPPVSSTSSGPPVQPPPVSSTSSAPPLQPAPVTSTCSAPPVQPPPVSSTSSAPPLQPAPVSSTSSVPLKHAPVTSTSIAPLKHAPVNFTSSAPPLVTSTSSGPPPLTSTSSAPSLHPPVTSSSSAPPLQTTPVTSVPLSVKTHMPCTTPPSVLSTSCSSVVPPSLSSSTMQHPSLPPPSAPPPPTLTAPVPKPRTVHLIVKRSPSSDVQNLPETSVISRPEIPPSARPGSEVDGANVAQTPPPEEEPESKELQNNSGSETGAEEEAANTGNPEEAPQQNQNVSSQETKDDETVGPHDDDDRAATQSSTEAKPHAQSEAPEAQGGNIQEITPKEFELESLVPSEILRKDEAGREATEQWDAEAPEHPPTGRESAANGKGDHVVQCRTYLARAHAPQRILYCEATAPDSATANAHLPRDSLQGVTSAQHTHMNPKHFSINAQRAPKAGSHTPDRPQHLQLSGTHVTDWGSPSAERELQPVISPVRTPTPDGFLPRTPPPDSRMHSPDPRAFTPDFRTPTPEGYMSPRDDSTLSTASDEYYECSSSPLNDLVFDRVGFQSYGTTADHYSARAKAASPVHMNNATWAEGKADDKKEKMMKLSVTEGRGHDEATARARGPVDGGGTPGEPANNATKGAFTNRVRPDEEQVEDEAALRPTETGRQKPPGQQQDGGLSPHSPPGPARPAVGAVWGPPLRLPQVAESRERTGQWQNRQLHPRAQAAVAHTRSNTQPQPRPRFKYQEDPVRGAHRQEERKSPFSLTFSKLYTLKGLKDRTSSRKNTY